MRCTVYTNVNNMAAARSNNIKLLHFLRKSKEKHEHSGQKTSQELWRMMKRSRKRRWRYFMTLAVLFLTMPPVDRRVWTLPRSSEWFNMAITTFSDKEWRDNFRLSKETFTYIVSMVGDAVSRKDTKLCKAISSQKRVAITLYFIGSTAEYRTIANLFGVSTCFVCKCIKDVSKAIVGKLRPLFLSIPKGEELLEIMNMYKEKWGFPCCAGAIDGTHVPIKAPIENHSDYVNRKSYHSVVMQAVVDSRYMFRDIVVGWPGSVHDARVLSNSKLYDLGTKCELFDSNTKQNILGCQIGPVILGDPAYPLLNWLMKGYPENPNTPYWQRHFNYRLSRARMTVENTFGRWKGRFRRFLKRVDMDVDALTYVVAASCIIHNICELRKDDFLEEWLEAIAGADEQPDNMPRHQDNQRETDAADIREIIALYFTTADGRNRGTGGD